MYKDELIYTDFYMAHFELENTAKDVMYYDVWLTSDMETLLPEEGRYKGREVLGGNSYKTIQVPIVNIKPDNLEKFYVCMQEKAENGTLAIVGRTCAKLRLYWPLAELRKLP
ncbi:hypothetical protein [Vibrio phage vB_VhaS-tm]|nr:hypothetical protein [Vibrio phage vB_VhaS-tm]